MDKDRSTEKPDNTKVIVSLIEEFIEKQDNHKGWFDVGQAKNAFMVNCATKKQKRLEAKIEGVKDMLRKIDKIANSVEYEKKRKHKEEMKRFKEQIQKAFDEVLDEIELEVEEWTKLLM